MLKKQEVRRTDLDNQLGVGVTEYSPDGSKFLMWVEEVEN
jgi:hypothetical protein